MQNGKSTRDLVRVAAGWTALAAVLSILPTAAVAAEVTLKMKNGDFSVTGQIQTFDRQSYKIFSPAFGTMTLDASRFDCIGSDCPTGPVAALATPPAPVTSGAPRTVAIHGSNTVGNQLMPGLIEGYAASIGGSVTKIVGANPLDLTLKLLDKSGREFGTVELHRHGSSTSFRELEKKSTEIGMSSRRIKPEEAQKLAAVGLGNMLAPTNEHVLGLDGLMVLVAQGNPAVSISLENVAKIYSGQITDWSELGLPAGKINVYAPTPDSGTFETFNQLVLEPRKLKVVETAKRTANHAEQSDWVARDQLGIGFAGIAYQRNAKALNIEASCGLITRPSTFTMKTEEYPLSRRLFLYTPGAPTDPMARNLLTFALSPAAQPIVKQNDFIDQAPDSLEFKEQTTRVAYGLNAQNEDFDLAMMRSLIADMKDAKRMSLTFRFDTGSYALDTKAQADVVRLRDLLQTSEYKNRRIMLMGFADAVGRFSNNLTLSERRAQAVQQALAAAGVAGAQVLPRAFSELAPVACNDSTEGRTLNRRVEVWVK